MFSVKFFLSLLLFSMILLFFSSTASAWGPAIHTVIACRIIDEAGFNILPAISSVIQSYPLEYIYGNMAADFFIGRGQKKKKGHSHNWESGFSLLNESRSEREASYAYGFLSHLAADVIAHNYFVPLQLSRHSTLKKIGHIYSEVMADRFVGPFYMRIARDVLSINRLECDNLLRSAVTGSCYGLKAKRHIFTQTVKISEYLYCFPGISQNMQKSGDKTGHESIVFMIGLSFRLVRDLLSNPEASPCLSHDPIGTRSIRNAGRKGFLSKVFRKKCGIEQGFTIDQRLLDI
ncbi:MAG: zinc dependent phospholipase C family protein [Deltaproteobacteria bacterium]|nr:zinc dependent phospholipase C family protein [Deltaproteobacteria bacterium]